MPIVAVGLALAFASGFAISAGAVAFGTLLFNIGIGLALSGALNFVTGLFQHTPTVITTRGRTVSARQPVSPWKVIYGSVRTGGVFTFIDARGADSSFLDLVITVAGHEIAGFDAMYFDGVEVPLDGAGAATGKYAGFVKVEYNLGSPTQAAFATLVASNPKWTVNHRQRGRAGAYVQLTWNADVFPNGVPTITFRVRGAKVYDPRTGLTGYSANNALCVRDYLTNTSYGMGAPVAEIDDAAFIAAANACDEDVALRQGGSEKRYTTNGTLDTSVQFGNAIKGLLSCAVGDLTYAGGLWGYYPATWRPPTNLADGRSGYTEDDLRGAIEFNPRASHRDIFNSVKGIYVSPEVNDQQADFPFVTDPAYVAEDNGEVLWKDLEFPFTNSSATAQRLGKIILRTARNQGIVKFPFRLTALQSVPPDVFRMTSGRFGWADKLFKVTDFQFASYQAEDGAPLLGVDLFARETAADIYDWTAATDQKLIDSTGTATPPGSALVTAPTLVVLTSITVTGSGGALQQAIDVTWHVTDAFVTSGGFINVQHAVNAANPIWIADQSVPGEDQETLITGVNSGTTYLVRIRAVNSSGAASAWVQKSITV